MGGNCWSERRNRSSRRVLTIVVVAARGLVGVVTTSGQGLAASTAVQGCAPDRGYAYTPPTSRTFDIVPPATGTPGTPLSVQIAVGLGVIGTVGGSVSGDVSAIIAGAQAQISSSISLSWTASVTYTAGPWTVPAGVHLGALHAGAERDSFTWQYGSYNGACKWILSRSGPIDVPWRAPYIWHTTS
jgi:hypothetical protein